MGDMKARNSQSSVRRAVADEARGHLRMMARRQGEWQRPLCETFSRSCAHGAKRQKSGGRPTTACEYPTFIGTDGEWGSHFDVALLAAVLQRSCRSTVIQRKLVVFDPRLRGLRVHPPASAETLIPTASIAPNSVSKYDVVIGLDPGLHWFSTKQR